MLKWYFILIAILVFFLPSCVYTHNIIPDSLFKRQQSLQSPLIFGGGVTEISPSNLQRVFGTVPPLDYVVLFYINLNTDCRNFFPLYSRLYNDLLSSGWRLKFVKFNCQGVGKGLQMCQDYNITVVPTVAYVSSYPVQRSNIPKNSYLRRFLSFLFFRKDSDIRLDNATRYPGDIFEYNQLRDWIGMMYHISTLNRRFGTPANLYKSLKDLWHHFLSFFDFLWK